MCRGHIEPASVVATDELFGFCLCFGIRLAARAGALGLLVSSLSAERRKSEFLSIYEGALRLGETTDSYDADGEVTSENLIPLMNVDELNEAAKSFLGDQQQIPPMVSAIKVGGKPLYKLAREGKDIPREPRLVHIYTYKFSEYEEPFGYFRVSCTKGTYVRSLAHDLGQKLGCGAHLTRLRRLGSGRFDVADATPLAEVLKWDPAELERHVIPFLKLKAYE